MENLNIREDVSDIVNKTELLADLQIGFWIIEYPNDEFQRCTVIQLCTRY